MTRADAVSPELAEYVLRRDGWCVVAVLFLGQNLRFPDCRDRWGRDVPPTVGRYPFCGPDVLTVAHVRDRRGGRMAKRPPSIPRRLVAACHGHHTLDPIVDLKDVRERVDAYLEELEGPDRDVTRPWERVRRVRSAELD